VASLQVIQGPDKGRVFDLPHGENVIGRQSSSAELCDLTVSRSHARLYPHNGAWLLEDAGSANGTYLNGIKIGKPTQLKRGDQIRCGSTLLVFRASSSERLAAVDVDEDGRLVDAAIVATVPSNEDSVIIPTPEAGAQAIGNLRVIYDLMAELGSVFNVDRLLDRTLDKIFEVVQADRGFIMLHDADGKLAVRASRVAEGSSPDDAAPVSRTIIREVMSKQVGVLSSNAMSDKRFAAGKSVHDFGIRSAICVPIKGRGGAMGVIHVDCSISQHTYSTEQLRLLTALGYQAGLAVENVRLYEAAVQSERLTAVGETVAVLSHHIKNMLQALDAGVDVVEMGIKAGSLDKAREAWPIVQRNLLRINELILNMLAFSKTRQPLLETLNINALVAECVELLTPRFDERGAALISDLDDVPAIPADSGGLHQAIMNLLVNAMDAVTAGKGVVTVSTRYDSMNRCVVVGVADNGSGIAPQQMEQIFRPFYSSKGQRGTGLGLAVARKVVQEHQGRIDVSSRLGQGTTFKVVLPTAARRDSGETMAGD
jgi:signal transduction histidine kinase